MTFLAINWLAVIIAAAAKFVIGAVWYAPPVLGKQWQEAAGVTPDASAMPRAIIIQIVGDLIMAYVLAQFIAHTAVTGLTGGAFVGAVAWLGFVATVMLGAMAYEGRPLKLFTINAAYQLLGIVVMGAIIGAMLPAAAAPAA